MATLPTVSVIVPTRNSAATLAACLASIQAQTYSPIELIVVDRDSTDDTKKIARQYGAKVYNHGPERSAQRNFGANQATGKYLLMIDSDMSLDPTVVSDCVAAMTRNTAAVIIPEQSFGEGFWAQCKRLERSFYVGNDAIEAPRFTTKALYEKLGGYNVDLTSGEDWDLGRRLGWLGF